MVAITGNAAEYRATPMEFLKVETNSVCNLTFAILVYVFTGVPHFMNYGAFEKEGSPYEADGSVQAGLKGSGAFWVTTVVTCVAFLIFLSKFVGFFCFPSEEEVQRREDYISMQKRLSSAASSMSMAKDKK